MANYRYFWDLQNSQAYTNHTVKQFDANTTTGGGMFKWVDVIDNTAIINIPGIRIKPTSNIKGYWERVIDGPWLVDWFGCNNSASQLTLTGYGFTTLQINTMFNSINKDVDGNTATGLNTVVGTDTYDTAAMKVAFNLMQLGYTTSIQFLSKDYYITSTCNLPLNYYSAALRPSNPYVITGNGAQITVHSSQNTAVFILWDRPLTGVVQANNQLNAKFIIDGLNFKGYSALTNFYQTGIRLGATTNSKITNVSFADLIRGVVFSYSYDIELSNIVCNNVPTGLTSSIGFWTGATALNSRNKDVLINKFRYSFNNSGGTGIEVTSGVENSLAIKDSFIDITSTTSTQGIFIDSAEPTRSITIDTLTINCTGPTLATSKAISIATNNSNIQINNIVNNSASILISSIVQYAGASNITVRNISRVNASSTFEYTESGGGYLQWLFENSRGFNPTDLSEWEGASVPANAAWTADGPAGLSTTRLRASYPFYSRG